ncbi:pseudouridine synthase [Actinokineospora sp. G85]|uniref:pseudouridine synthase n=1 Tax=Actinokineospora sp. G85 TaxID=3406626 RepID=UPI003C73FAF1
MSPRPNQPSGSRGGKRADQGKRGAAGSGRGQAPRGGQPQRRGGAQPPKVNKPQPRKPLSASEQNEGVRLQKVLSSAGVASRRAAEELIDQGRVQVDGEIVREQGRRVDPDTVVIHVDGVRVNVREDRIYMALNKPQGMHSTMTDDLGRPCVGDLLRERVDKLFHVGRLDAETEGLLLLTNDGDLAHKLMHPSFEVAKTYLAEVPAPIGRDVGKRLREGVVLEDGPAKVDSFRLVDSHAGKAMVEVVVHEGRKHIVRRMLEEVGHPVTKLIRTQIAGVHLGNQRPGGIRSLNRAEIGALFDAVDTDD